MIVEAKLVACGPVGGRSVATAPLPGPIARPVSVTSALDNSDPNGRLPLEPSGRCQPAAFSLMARACSHSQSTGIASEDARIGEP
jgi:hypothetical protein